MTTSIDHSVIIPVYNSDNCLEELCARLTGVFEKMSASFEIILVNDYSRDMSWQVISRLSQTDPRIRGISFRKNFGQDNALLAGLNHSRGKRVTIMDDDLQHDPAHIPQLASELDKGYDVVYAQYKRKRQRLWKNFGSWFNGKVAEAVLHKPKEVYLSPYKMISGSLREDICKYDGPHPYVDGLLFRTTARFSNIEIEHRERFRGTSTYTFTKSLRVWSYLATNFSVLPLRVATTMGLTISGFGVLFALVFILERLLFPNSETPIGWASMMVGILVLGGAQLFAIGIVGEYVGRTFLNINKHPQFTVHEKTWS